MLLRHDKLAIKHGMHGTGCNPGLRVVGSEPGEHSVMMHCIHQLLSFKRYASDSQWATLGQ